MPGTLFKIRSFYNRIFLKLCTSMPTNTNFGMMKELFVTKKKILGIAVVSTLIAFIVLSNINGQVEEEVATYSSIIANLQDIKHTIVTDSCSSETYMLVLCGSNPVHREVRDAIRETWGNPKIPNFPFRLVFLFGKPTNDILQRNLEEESLKYGDILQGDFVDSYHNITPRDLMGLKWAWDNCKQAHFICRADDDVAFDVYHLIDVLEERFAKMKDFVACFYITRNAPVERSGRYGLTVEKFPNNTYPDFCHGWMYMLTPSMADKLVRISSEVEPYWINDVYITGSLVKALQMDVEDLYMNYTLDYAMSIRLLHGYNTLPYKVLPTRAKSSVTRELQDLYRKSALRMGLPHHKSPKRHLSPLVAL